MKTLLKRFICHALLVEILKIFYFLLGVFVFFASVALVIRNFYQLFDLNF